MQGRTNNDRWTPSNGTSKNIWWDNRGEKGRRLAGESWGRKGREERGGRSGLRSSGDGAGWLW